MESEQSCLPGVHMEVKGRVVTDERAESAAKTIESTHERPVFYTTLVEKPTNFSTESLEIRELGMGDA